jgi:hypothetical protein
MSKDDLEACTAADVRGWVVDGVARAAWGLGLSKAAVVILWNQEVHGKALLKMTEDKLTTHPYNMKGGPASDLAEFIQDKLPGAPPTPLARAVARTRAAVVWGAAVALRSVW